MTARRVTDALLLEALALLPSRFTVNALQIVLGHVGITAFTQARYWLLYHAPHHPALIRIATRVKPVGPGGGRPSILYEVTEYGKRRLNDASKV
jgi:hypothetical protein